MVDEHFKDLFSIIEPLGGGSYGQVNLAETLDRKTKLVVKFVNI